MGNKGQALVEVAISLVVLLTLLVGMAEVGIALFQYIELRDAAQEGAIYGSMCGCSHSCTPNDIEMRIRGTSDAPINLTNSDVIVQLVAYNPSGTVENLSASKDGDSLDVHVQYDHKIVMPFLPRIIGRSSILLDAQSTSTILCSGINE